jgi:hypothetical protein
MTRGRPRRSLAAACTPFLLVILWSCWFPSTTPPLLPDAASAPPEIRRACDMTARRCTRCHTIDRILVAQVTSARHWEAYVQHMRHMPTSGIGEADGAEIVRCLVYRSFGTSGESP